MGQPVQPGASPWVCQVTPLFASLPLPVPCQLPPLLAPSGFLPELCSLSALGAQRVAPASFT